MQIDQPVLTAKTQEREKSLETARSRMSQQRQDAPLESAASVVSHNTIQSSALTHQLEGGNARQTTAPDSTKHQSTKRVEINNNLRMNANVPSGQPARASPTAWTGRKMGTQSKEKLTGLEAIYDGHGGRDSKLSKNSLKQLDGKAEVKTKRTQEYVREHSPLKMATGGDQIKPDTANGSVMDAAATISGTVSAKADIDSGVHRSTEGSPHEQRGLKSKSKAKLMTGEEEQRSKELIQQFGVNKGKQYYGAIRELEEFLDPNVLQDDDFQFDEKTRDEIKTIETKRVRLVEATGSLPKNNSMIRTGRHAAMQNSLTGPTRSREQMMTSVGHDTLPSRGIGGKSLNTHATAIKKQMAGIIYTQSEQGDNRITLPSQSMQQYVQTPLREVRPIDPVRKYDVSYLRQQRASQNVDAINSSLLKVAGDDSQFGGAGSVASGFEGGPQFDVNSVATYPARLDQTGPVMQPMLRNPLALAPIKRKPGRNSKGKSRTNVRQRPMGIGALNSQYNSLQSSVQGPATLHAYPAAEPVSPTIRAQLQTQAGKRTQNSSTVTGAKNSNAYGMESSYRELTAEQANLKYLTHHLQMQGQTPDPRLGGNVEAPASVFKGKRLSTQATSQGPEIRKFASTSKRMVGPASRNDSLAHVDTTSAREALPRIGSRAGGDGRSDAHDKRLQTFGRNLHAGSAAIGFSEPDGQSAGPRGAGQVSSLQRRRVIPQFLDQPAKSQNVQLKKNGHFFDTQKIGKMYRNDNVRKHAYNSQNAQNAQMNATAVQKMAQLNWVNHKKEMAAIGASCEDCPQPQDTSKSRKGDRMRRTGGFTSPKNNQLNQSQVNPIPIKRIKERRRTDESIGQQEIQVARQSLMKGRQQPNPPDSVRNAKTQQVKKRGALRANQDHFNAKQSQPRIGGAEEPLTPDQLIEGTDARTFSKALQKRKQSKATVEGPTTSTAPPNDTSVISGLPSGLFSNLDQVSSSQVDGLQHGNLNLVNINVNVNMSDGDKLTKREKDLLTYINKKIASVEEQKQFYIQQQAALLTGQRFDDPSSFELAKVKHKKKVSKRKKELLHALLKQPQVVDPSSRQASVPKSRHRTRPSAVSSHHDVTRSMPSKQLMNKLVSRGAYASSRRDKDEDYPMSSRVHDPRPRASRLRSSQLKSIDVRSGLAQGKHQLSVDDPRRSQIETNQRGYELSANRQVRRTNFSPSPSTNPKNSRRTEQLNNTLRAPRGNRELAEDSVWMAGKPVGRVLPSNSSYRDKIRHSRSLSKERAHLSPASGGSDMSLHSGVMSEVDRQMHRNDRNKQQRVMLDQEHLAKLKKPENFHNASYLHPEKLTTNAKKDLDELSFGSKKAAHRDPAHGLDHPMRSNSAQNVMISGLNYKFKLNDLSKYSQKLKFRDINWKIKLSALGKKIPDIKQRKKILVKGSHFNTLLKLLRQTDWATTPVYHQFQLNGRWKHIDNSIYSEIELQYQVSFLAKYVADADAKADDIAEPEAQQLVQTHFVKTMHTCEVLMNQLNMMYYLEKIKLYFVDEEPTIQQLQKLMSRCLKLYELINAFMKAFKLIEKVEIAIELGKPDARLLQRLKTAVALLLKENPVLPAFTFKGSDLLAQVKSDLRALGFDVPEDTPRSPARSKGRARKLADGGAACAMCPAHAGAGCPHKSSKQSMEDDGEVLSLGDGFAI